MAQRGYVGKHRKPREGRDGARAVSLVAAALLVIGAVATVALTDDTRYLRAAVVAALIGALIPMLALRRSDGRTAEFAASAEVAELRAEIARLRADVAPFAAVPRPHSPDRVATTLHLPLVRAAFADEAPAGVANGNGHNGQAYGTQQAIDLTAQSLSLVDVAHDEEQRAQHGHDLAH